MCRALSLTFTCSLIAMIASCAPDGSELVEPSTPDAPVDEPPTPVAPVDEGPTDSGEACRTVDDCLASEHCVKGTGRNHVCAPIDDGSSIPPRGPKGQPPPPTGLFEGAPGFAGRGAGTAR